MMRKHFLYGPIHCYGKATNENSALSLPLWKGKCGQLCSSQGPLNKKQTHYSEVPQWLVLRSDRNFSHCTWQSYTVRSVRNSILYSMQIINAVRSFISLGGLQAQFRESVIITCELSFLSWLQLDSLMNISKVIKISSNYTRILNNTLILLVFADSLGSPLISIWHCLYKSTDRFTYFKIYFLFQIFKNSWLYLFSKTTVLSHRRVTVVYATNLIVSYVTLFPQPAQLLIFCKAQGTL